MLFLDPRSKSSELNIKAQKSGTQRTYREQGGEGVIERRRVGYRCYEEIKDKVLGYLNCGEKREIIQRRDIGETHQTTRA